LKILDQEGTFNDHW